jgi:DNA-directed RNA polymerase subunit RPC12/RpoP
VDGSLFDPWKDKIEGVDYVACAHCGHKALNLVRHLKREHGGIEGYKGQVKSQKCVENLSSAANAAWDKRGRSPERDGSQNKTHKPHGLTKEILESLYTIEGLSDAKIGERYGMTGEGVAYYRRKFGIAAHRLAV